MSVYDFVRDKAAPASTVWAATFAEDVDELSDLAYVIIPAFNDQLRWGPCFWQARDAISTPARGDRALVVFDETGVPWVTSWWPF